MNPTPENDLLACLRRIQQRPSMYFGPDVSIGHLHSFIAGFYLGQRAPDSEDILDCFTTWVADHYETGEGGPPWSLRLLQQARGDQRAAFDLFFTHLDSYLADRVQLGASGIRARAQQRTLHRIELDEPNA